MPDYRTIWTGYHIDENKSDVSVHSAAISTSDFHEKPERFGSFWNFNYQIKLEEILGFVAMVNKGDELGVDLAPGLQGLYTIKI